MIQGILSIVAAIFFKSVVPKVGAMRPCGEITELSSHCPSCSTSYESSVQDLSPLANLLCYLLASGNGYVDKGLEQNTVDTGSSSSSSSAPGIELY